MFKKTVVAIAATALFATGAMAEATRTGGNDSGVKRGLDTGRKGLDTGRKGLDTGKTGNDSGVKSGETRTSSTVRGR
jgi:hypothetical protein